MRQAGDKLPDRVHFLCLQELGLGALALGRFGQQAVIGLRQFAGALGNALLQPVIEVTQRRLCALLIGDVPRDLRGADDPAGDVAHRRDRHRNIDLAPILTASYGFKVVDPLAASYAFEDHVLFQQAVSREQPGNRLTDHFLGCVSEDRLGSPVPARDDALERLADDRVVGAFDDSAEIGASIVRFLTLANIDEHVHRADQLARGIAQRCRIGCERDPRAVGPLEDRLCAADGTVFLEGHRHRAFIMPHRAPIHRIEPPADAPLIGAKPRLAPGQIGGGPVVIGDAAVRIGDVDRGRQHVQQGTKPSLGGRSVQSHSIGIAQNGGAAGRLIHCRAPVDPCAALSRHKPLS